MNNYQKLLKKILDVGDYRLDRTQVGTYSLFGERLEWDLSKGFPAVTTKKLAWKSVVSELLWFLSGSTNIEDLRKRLHGDKEGKTIWDENYENQGVALGYTEGELGPVYGKQWRNFMGVDQIVELIASIKENPESRRHLVSAWNVPEIPSMTLPPCHYAFQCHVTTSGQLDLMWTQRSVDSFLGLPFNIASYALLTHILADLTGLTPGKLIFIGGDVHIYDNHTTQVLELLSKDPLELPKLHMPKFSTLEQVLDTDVNDFNLIDYYHHGQISAPMAI